MVGMTAARIFPTYSEYRAILGAIELAKAKAPLMADMQRAFNANANINDIKSVTAKDLIYTKDGTNVEISFAYEQRIGLFGPVSLLIEYAGTTEKSGKRAEQD